MKKIILFLLIGFFSFGLYGQTGPGSVGNNDGSDGQPRNILWIDAQILSLSYGDAFSSWPDISGNVHYMTSDGSAPSYIAEPDKVPAYISIANGNWAGEIICDTYPTLEGTVPSDDQRGAIAIVEHKVTIPSNYILNYKITICAVRLLG